jgi:hypothetical protein
MLSVLERDRVWLWIPYVSAALKMSCHAEEFPCFITGCPSGLSCALSTARVLRCVLNVLCIDSLHSPPAVIRCRNAFDASFHQTPSAPYRMIRGGKQGSSSRLIDGPVDVFQPDGRASPKQPSNPIPISKAHAVALILSMPKDA